MRILFLAFRDPSNPYAGGGDIYINELAKGCAKRGHSVTMVSSRFPGSKAEEFVEGVRIIRFGSGFTMLPKVFTHYFKHLRGKFDIVVEEIMGGPRIPFFACIYMKEKLVGILQQRHKEIFQHQFSFPVASFLAFLERLLALLYRGKVVIVNSSRTRRDLREIGFLESRMHIVYPGLQKWFFTVVNANFSARRPRVVCLTKIRRYKLIDCAVRAMKSVCKAVPNCELIIAGRTNDVESRYEEELRCLVEDLGLSNNVSFRKDISETEKIELLRTCRALVLPSAIEGFGIVVIEANACGTPAIVSDRIPKDAAIDGYNAIVFPCHDEESLSTAISSLVLDEVMWTKMSMKAKHFTGGFAWDRSVDRFAEVIKNV
jgi:glycosyltransferase involved in cell wall biosynthesis